MSYIIENNSFTGDSYGVRATRLYFLSNSIDTYAAALSITGDQLTWAQGAVAAFDAAQDTQSAELGEKNEAFQTSQESDAELQDRYQILKELLQARYGIDDDKLKIYGISGQTPRTRTEMIDKAEALIEGNTRQLAASDPEALPQTMIDNLQILVDDAKDKYYLAGIERREAEEATVEIQTMYADDVDKLRSIYHWVVAFWGKRDPRLIDLGFVTAKDQSGGGPTPAVPQNLAYDSGTGAFSWDAVDGATSYQLSYRATGSSDEWQEAYSGSDIGVVFDPGAASWDFRVRARNSNGYGDWSAVISVVISGTLGIPQNFTVVHELDGSVHRLVFNWDLVTGATLYRIYMSMVDIGDPAGSYILAGIPSTSPWTLSPTPSKRYYFYIKASDGTVDSDASPVEMVDTPAW